MSQYGSVEYWNERYSQKKEGFEWYTEYSTLKDHLSKYMKKDDKILNIGCGDSSLSEDLYRDGYVDITSCDYSSVVIQKMKDACVDKSGLKWDVMDLHNMTYEDGSFDVVLDKAALDAVICGDESFCDPDKVISEIYRVLKNNGVYICISYGTPEFRMDYFQNPSHKWKVTHSAIPKLVVSSQSNQAGIEYCHHIYFCRKSEFFVCLTINESFIGYRRTVKFALIEYSFDIY